jgi:hypothetical protein
MSCVAHMKTKKNHHHVKPQTPAPSLAPASFIMASTRPPSQIIPNADRVWIGKIQLFLRPTFGDQIASTIGLQSSFIE